ncbi:hypothetical protein MTO96_046205, partial [Rhipicephalus appendiculatus]
QPGTTEQTGVAANKQSRPLLLLLLPFLVGAAVVIALTVFWVWRRYRLAREESFILEPLLPTFDQPRVDPGPP